MSKNLIDENESNIPEGTNYDLFSVEESEKELEETLPFLPYKIFMNYVDSFNAKYIASNLADQYYGELKEQEQDMQISGEGAEYPEEKIEEVIDERNKYEIIGTLRSPVCTKTEDILYVIDEKAKNFKQHINSCGVIIYDISRNPEEIPKAIKTLKFLINQLDELEKIGPKTYKEDPRNRIFILISSVMTWARTKSAFMKRPTPIRDNQYRKRRAHPDYKIHLECEKEVIALGKKHKKKLKTYVINVGITYGYEEDAFDFYFKLAWLNEHLPIFDKGSNNLALIHISDFAKIITKLVMEPPKKKYILAVEPTSSKLRKIVRAISKNLGKGFTQEIENLEDACTVQGVNKKNYELFRMDLRMDPAFILESFPIQWDYETGFLVNINRLIEEMKESRGITPIKLLIHGPPASGKTRLAERICKEYGLHYISLKTLIEETLQNLRDNITEEKKRIKSIQERERQKLLDAEEEEIEDEEGEEVIEEEEGPVDIEEFEEQIRDIQAMLTDSGNNKLPEEQVTILLKKFLESHICQNQGFVLDGFPKTIEQAHDLFGLLGDEGEEEQPGETDENEDDKLSAIANSKIMPQFVFSLRAPDEFLFERIKKLQERDIEGTHYAEEEMKKRIEIFRELNSEDDTVLNFFDEMEIHPILFDATKDGTENMDIIFEAIKNILGKPITFGMSLEEYLESQEQDKQKQKDALENLEMQQKIHEQKAMESYKKQLTKWTDALARIQEEEMKLKLAQSEPLRTYLMEYVFPTLTKALMEIVRVKPDDPVDFLAEYLFKINPEGKMFDPTFNQEGEELLNLCREVLEMSNIQI